MVRDAESTELKNMNHIASSLCKECTFLIFQRQTSIFENFQNDYRKTDMLFSNFGEESDIFEIYQ